MLGAHAKQSNVSRNRAQTELCVGFYTRPFQIMRAFLITSLAIYLR